MGEINPQKGFEDSYLQDQIRFRLNPNMTQIEINLKPKELA